MDLLKGVKNFLIIVNLIMFVFGMFQGYNPGTVGADSYSINVDMNNMVIIILVLVFAVSLVGFKVMNSGLSDESVKMILRALVYVFLWAIFSVYTLSLLNMVPIWGMAIYSSMTFLYALSLFMEAVK